MESQNMKKIESQKLGTKPFQFQYRHLIFGKCVIEFYSAAIQCVIRLVCKPFLRKKIQFKQMSWYCDIQKKDKFVENFIWISVQHLLLHLLVFHHHLPRILSRYFYNIFSYICIATTLFYIFILPKFHFFSGLSRSYQSVFQAEHFLLCCRLKSLKLILLLCPALHCP